MAEPRRISRYLAVDMYRPVIEQIKALAAGPADTTGAKKKVVFVPGHQSHGWSGHAYTADCKLVAGILNKNMPQIEATVIEGG